MIRNVLLILLITFIMLSGIDFISYLLLQDQLKNKDKPNIVINTSLFTNEEGILKKRYKDITKHYFAYDATLGFRFKPNSELIALTADNYGNPIVAEEIKLRTDKYGIISNNYKNTVYKPLNDVYTIIVTGGSTVAGWGASDNTKTWVAQLERMLINSKVFNGYKYVRVINAGVFGYRSAQELKRFQEELIYLKPNMVIMFNGINEPWTYKGNSVDFSTHSQQNEMMDFFNHYNSDQRFSIFMPYTMKLLSLAQKKNKKDIYGYKNSRLKLSSSELYISKVKQFDAICKENDIKFLYYLQPIMGADSKKLSSEEEKLKRFFGSIYYKEPWSNYKRKLNRFYNDVEHLIQGENKVYYQSLRNIFNDFNNTLYNDPRHYNDDGQHIIAKIVMKDVVNKYTEDRDRKKFLYGISEKKIENNLLSLRGWVLNGEPITEVILYINENRYVLKDFSMRKDIFHKYPIYHQNKSGFKFKNIKIGDNTRKIQLIFKSQSKSIKTIVLKLR